MKNIKLKHEHIWLLSNDGNFYITGNINVTHITTKCISRGNVQYIKESITIFYITLDFLKSINTEIIILRNDGDDKLLSA